MPAVINTDQETLTKIIADSETPVLVDFWAEWCGPCKQITPVLEQLAEDFGNRLQIVKLNIDNNPEGAAGHAVRSIPTLILFKNGDEAGRHVGSASKSELSKFIEGALG